MRDRIQVFPTEDGVGGTGRPLSRGRGRVFGMTDEIWKPVVGFEGLYEVSDQGRVRSLPRKGASGSRYYGGGYLKGHALKWGHIYVTLRRPGAKAYKNSVHRIVLEAFVGPCPEGMEGCHNNGNAGDNRLENLRWDTHSENMKDVVRHGNHPLSKKERCPRGHLLSEPNLIESSKRRGSRGCKACLRALSLARYYGTELDIELADKKYLEIMSGQEVL